ncbi:Helicase associated domain protein [Streptomyces sp. NPDC006458]|uniref:DEAD/DEAH box helicase n=1 Tax=Streptomyces sp. NPDC006458 TaxID=3154302 RepID=UPI0033B27A34
MPKIELRPHQVEAVDGVMRNLQTPPGGHMPPEGLRTQAIAATGSGKTLIAVESARRLSARRVLVLVPTLDLLTQMAAAWRQGGRRGAMVGVCSLRVQDSGGVPCTTDPGELAEWLRDLDSVTVFATYAAIGLGILQRAHEAGLGVWDLMVVDEAHRTSGDTGKPWAAVHDQARIPAVRRLYMTATARVWEAEGHMPRLVASMDEDSPVFGPVAYKLKLSEAIQRGLVAPYQVVCMDIRDPEVHTAIAVGSAGSDSVRGARLAALQTGLLTAAAKERLRRVLTFHSRVAEAEAMAAGVPGVAVRLRAEDPETFPPAERVWAEWLYGEHPTSHRREVLAEFASDFIADNADRESDISAALRVLSSVKVLGEGVDTANCDAVAFCDARGSMVDIVQMVGRALRIQPGRGKIATLVVPVFLSPGEEAGEMLTSDAYGTLAKVLGALRAHDTDTIEALADPRPRSGRYEHPEDDKHGTHPEQDLDQADSEGADAGRSAARGLLRFSEERDPVQIAQFIRLRVIDPEKTYWRRGIAAAMRWLQETGAEQLRVPYDYRVPDDGAGAAAGFPLGVWLADQRRYYNSGDLDAKRAEQLEAVGMVWSHHDVAWEEGLAVARSYAAAHGHLLPPTHAAWDGYPIGVWAKNQRAAARKATQNAERRAAGDAVSYTGELPESRLKDLEDLDTGWCPTGWDIAWQRAFRLTHAHLKDGGTLPHTAGQILAQGEDLGAWTAAQRLGWDKLLPAQQWLLENVLGLQPADDDEQPKGRTQDDKWATNLTAAHQYHAREGHLAVPRHHTERLQDGTEIKLGGWLSNTRRRANTLTPQRRADLNALGMKW